MAIYVRAADGGGARRLPDHTGHDEGPFLSPDETPIAFARGAANADGDISVMKVDSSGQLAPTATPGRD